MASLAPGADTPYSPNARIPIAKKTGKSRNCMGLAFHFQYDGIGHWPNYTSTDSCIECKRETNTCCIKCETPLCIKYNGGKIVSLIVFITTTQPPRTKRFLHPI